MSALTCTRWNAVELSRVLGSLTRAPPDHNGRPSAHSSSIPDSDSDSGEDVGAWGAGSEVS